MNKKRLSDCEIGLLTLEDISSPNKSKVIETLTTKCSISDLAILTGVEPSKTSRSTYFNNTNDLLGRTGAYYIASDTIKNNMEIVMMNGALNSESISKRNKGIRPVIKLDNLDLIKDLPTYEIAGLTVVEYGEYPQYAVPEKLGNELNYLLWNFALKTTKKVYHIDNTEIDDHTSQPRYEPLLEYKYQNKKYVKVNNKIDSSPKTSKDETIYRYSEKWLEVSPIKWFVDYEKKLLISELILLGGIWMNQSITKDIMFYETEMYHYLNNYLKTEIISDELSKRKKEQRVNPYNFKINKVSEEDIIKGAIERNIAVFLHGRSSEGKSARIKELDPNCIIIYLRNATPESLNGKSVYNQTTGELIDIKPTWLKKLEDICLKEPDKYHIVFFDEITNAMLSIQGMAFNIILDKEVNGIWKLPENARIVAAGNDIKDSLAANQLAEPFFNRFAHVYIETTPESWLKWASTHHIHPAIYSYIAYKRGIPLRSKYTGEKPNADPRKWEMASKILYKTNKPKMLRALLGEDITNEFCHFCNQHVITLENVLNDNYTEEDLQMNTAEIYATVMGLSQVDETNFEKVRNFILRLGAEPCAVFETLWTQGNESRMEIVVESQINNPKILKKKKGEL